VTRHARSGNWRGRANQGSRERLAGSRRRRRADAALEGEVRWIDREQDVIHVIVTAAPSEAPELVGKVVEIGYARPRLRLHIRDRDGDGRLDGDDMALGDRVRAKGFRLRRDSDGAIELRIEARRLDAT
jgi:hypothetical protein